MESVVCVCVCVCDYVDEFFVFLIFKIKATLLFWHKEEIIFPLYKFLQAGRE